MEHPVLTAARHCRICAADLPMGPNPIFRIDARARIVLISQAPGRLAHQRSIAWDDPGGRRLREWLGLDDALFFDTPFLAVLPMGLCYPGKGKGGDLPPRPECAPNWQQPLLELMPHRRLHLLIGQYAQRHYLRDRAKRNLTETVRAFREYLPEYLPLPHPSPRNRMWLARNEWFELEHLPVLRGLVRQILDEAST